MTKEVSKWHLTWNIYSVRNNVQKVSSPLLEIRWEFLHSKNLEPFSIKELFTTDGLTVRRTPTDSSPPWSSVVNNKKVRNPLGKTPRKFVIHPDTANLVIGKKKLFSVGFEPSTFWIWPFIAYFLADIDNKKNVSRRIRTQYLSWPLV